MEAKRKLSRGPRRTVTTPCSGFKAKLNLTKKVSKGPPIAHGAEEKMTATPGQLGN